MAEKEVEALESLARTLNEFDQNKLWVIAIVIIALVVSYSLRWYFNWKSKQFAERNISQLSNSLMNVSEIMTQHESASHNRMTKLTTIMEEIRDRQKNVIGKSDSIRIVLNKFNDVVKREIIGIFEWSIINNDYEGRKDFVRKKVKTAIAESITMAQKSLSEFNLSVELEQFFITYKNKKDGNIHLKMVDLLWEDVEPIYHKSKYAGNNIEEQQLEEMQIAVNNVITAELTKIQMEINNLYR